MTRRTEYAAVIGAEAHWLSRAIHESANDFGRDGTAVTELFNLAVKHGRHEVVTEPRREA